MKKIVLLIITLFLTTQTIKAQTVVLDANGVTIKWTGATVPSPYFVQANPRGTGMEWFAVVDDDTRINITDYAKNIQSGITFFTPPGQSNPIPFNNIVTSLVTYMVSLFDGATSFNQPIGSWDVSNVTEMYWMFWAATSFNQPIGSWDVSNVTDMDGMFASAFSFNQPIGSWDVSSVTWIFDMFWNAFSFNQPIGSWDVSNVTNMDRMFGDATSFNQPIGSWDVSSVNWMSDVFSDATAFNQPIGSWDVSNVIDMYGMFSNATNFNQNISAWNVSNVTNMYDMFSNAGLSTANYDALLIGWSTISPNETPLKPNVTFSGGNSKYCNGATARASIISTYGWTITDGGLDCTSLDTETFDTSNLKIYPNPVINVLNLKVDSNLVNQPYDVIDGLGRVVLKGKLNDVDASINVEQLSKGIYYLKVSDKNASKFIKE
jgi:surface protein